MLMIQFECHSGRWVQPSTPKCWQLEFLLSKIKHWLF